MKYYTVRRREYSGYECDGHDQLYIVGANNEEDALKLLDNRGEWEKEAGYDQLTVNELVLPDLKRKKKAFIYKNSND